MERNPYVVSHKHKFSEFCLKQKALLDYINFNYEEVHKVIELMVDTINKEGYIYICGNGGSYCSALHFAEDMMKCANLNTSKAIKCFALGANPGLLTCLSNDYSYDEIFSKELSFLSLKKDDLLIGLSVSGSSPNVYNAIMRSTKECKTVLITGNNYENIEKYHTDTVILSFPNNEFSHVEDMTMFVLHYICNNIHLYI